MQVDCHDSVESSLGVQLRCALSVVSSPATYADVVVSERAARHARAMGGLMLFTIEGLLRAATRYRQKGICDPYQMTCNAWSRYVSLCKGSPRGADDGWLATALPSSLLYGDEVILRGLTALAAGRSDTTIYVPPAFLLPIEAFAQLTGNPGLLRRFSAQLPGMALPSHRTAARLPKVATDLVRDFVEMQRGLPTNSTKYPGY